MSAVFVTTSRKPSVLTKRFGKLLAKLFPFGVYENRGKMSVGEAAIRASTLGKERACIIHEVKGNPMKIVFLKSGERWLWLSPELMISKLKFGTAKVEGCERIEITGEKKEELKKLVSPRSREIEADDGCMQLKADEKKIVFSLGKVELLSMDVEYHEHESNA